MGVGGVLAIVVALDVSQRLSRNCDKCLHFLRCRHCCCNCCCLGLAIQNRRTSVTNPRVYVAAAIVVAIVVALGFATQNRHTNVTKPRVYVTVAIVVAIVVASDVLPQFCFASVTNPRVYGSVAIVVAWICDPKPNA